MSANQTINYMNFIHFPKTQITLTKPMRRLVMAARFGFMLTLMTTNIHAQKQASLPTRIVCFGDSMTDGDTYPQLIMQAFHEAGGPVPALICSGVGGETMKQMDTRFDKTVAVFKPEMVTVLEGTNDAFSNTSPEDYEKSLRSIVAKVKAIGAQVMLVTPSECVARHGKTEAEKDAFLKNVETHLESYDAIVRKVATENSCLLAQNRNLFQAGLKAGENLFVEDGTHPNYLGQSLMARSILDALGHPETALPKSFDPKPLPGLIAEWKLRPSPLDEKKQPVRLDADAVSKLSPDATWVTCHLPEQPPVADSPEIWIEQMRRNGAVMKSETLIGKGPMGQGVATVDSANGGPAFIQTGMGIATVWLNGVMVHDQMKVWGGAHPGKDRIPVTLNKGANTIVMEFKDNFFLAVTPNLIWEDQLY
jgi:lysophospholipase L1-like esterase